MEWEKLGLIWSASEKLSWGSMGTLTPTPFLMEMELFVFTVG